MEKLLTRKEAARLLGISIKTLDSARNNGLVSFVQYFYRVESSGIRRTVNAQSKTEGDQYRNYIQESEKRCSKVTSLIQERLPERI